MFTGLIETIGTIQTVQRGSKSVTLGIAVMENNFKASLGDSIAIDGVCLTVERIRSDCFSFTAVHETLKHTTLSNVFSGNNVNLERALPLQGRLDGHMVLGHVDGVGEIKSRNKVGDSILFSIAVPKELIRFMAPKGSVAIDGISLTIVEYNESCITLSLIPHTLAQTTLMEKGVGKKVNIECDVLARYIYHQLTNLQQGSRSGEPSSSSGESNSLMSLLERSGF